jgi:hypothetical protein
MASHPLNESTGTLHEENTETANPGNSPYLAFGKTLKRELRYPIGLVQAALGGSALKSWNPDEDGFLYRNMMNIIQAAGGKIKGVLWYQGCTDTDQEITADTYLERFTNMVKHLRSDLGDPAISVLTVQLNRCVGPSTAILDICWGKVREAQRQAPKKQAHVYVVPATDLSLSDEIHNSSPGNIVLGERLAKTALAYVYGCGTMNKAPDLLKAERLEENSIKLTFANVTSRLFIFTAPSGNLPFTVEDETGTAAIDSWEYDGGDKIILKLARPLQGKAFAHGAFERNPVSTVPMDINGYMPMLSFYGVEIN